MLIDIAHVRAQLGQGIGLVPEPFGKGGVEPGQPILPVHGPNGIFLMPNGLHGVVDQ